MDYAETPENDDFRGRDLDCFLERKRLYRKRKSWKGEGSKCSLEGKSIENLPPPT